MYGRENWLLVLAGTPTLRHPQGEDHLGPGDLVCLPEGPAGAHRLLNRREPAARALFLSTTGLPANVRYPDTGGWLIRNALTVDPVAVRVPPPGADPGSVNSAAIVLAGSPGPASHGPAGSTKTVMADTRRCSSSSRTSSSSGTARFSRGIEAVGAEGELAVDAERHEVPTWRRRRR